MNYLPDPFTSTAKEPRYGCSCLPVTIEAQYVIVSRYGEFDADGFALCPQCRQRLSRVA